MLKTSGLGYFPCKVETENWYWNRKLQVVLADRNITWGVYADGNVGWNSRKRKYLAIVPKHTGGFILQWMTKSDFDKAELQSFGAKDLARSLNIAEKWKGILE